MGKRRTGDLLWKVKRRLIDLAYSLRFWRREPSRYIEKVSIGIYLAVIFFAVFVLAGGIFDLLEKPLALLPQGSGWTFIYSGNIHLQTVSESVVVGIVYLLGIIGFYMMSRSTRLVYHPRQAYILLIIGVVIVLLTVFYSTILLQSKIGI